MVLTHGEHHGHALSLGLEWILVGVSVAVAVAGIALAYRFYYLDKGFARAAHLASRFPLGYKLLLNKYWIDEIYAATVIQPLLKFSDLLWEFDARVVDGAVNGARNLTVGSSWVSGIFDLQVIDGMVNLVGKSYDVASHQFRRLQVGFAQGYAMVMVFGAALLLGIFFVVNL